MCSIFLSTNLESFKDLINLNQSRGKFSYSYSIFKDGKFKIIRKDFGLFDTSVLENAPIHIGHCQAPTGGMIKDKNKIHPAEIQNHYLFHNGIVLPRYLQDSGYEGWDTYFILHQLFKNGFDSLNHIQGSFACVFVKNTDIYFFRNSLCNLYIKNKEYISLSSVPFPDAELIEKEKIFSLEENKIFNISSFKDKNIIYYEK